jgi:hypothetical protein
LTRGVVLRGLGLAVAIGLGAVGVWLIATGDTPKRIQIGVLAGFWGVLIGAFAMFGSRRHADEPAPAASLSPGGELELRARVTELERAEQAAFRREHEQRLEQLLRHEIQAAVAREVGAMRHEIAQLRGELLEKVGGQLRLERIETTRLIGSDLEALQHELRELKHITRETPIREAPALGRIVEPARVRPVSRETAEVEADVQPARQPRAEPKPPVAPPPAAPTPAAQQAPVPPAPGTAPTAGIPPVPGAPVRGQSAAPPPPAAPAQPAPGPPPAAPDPAASPADPFAGLPRIRPFTDFELDPIDDEPQYTGRRRRTEDEEPTPDGDEPRGRHSSGPGDGAPGPRRRAPEDGHDLLARLLAREGR